MLTSIPAEGPSITKKSIVAFKKNQQVKRALSYLYQEGSCTLAKLAEMLNTSVPSVTLIIEQLIDEGWVSTLGTVSGNNGRRPVLFSLNPVGHYALILDSNTHETKLMLVNLLRQIVFQHSADTILENKASFSDFLVSFVNEALAESGIAKTDVIGVGLSMPGLIDSRQGLNLSYPDLGLPEQSIKVWLEQQWGLPVFMINDTKATALGEHRFGSSQGKQHALTINIDWGVGLAIISNGEVFHGASGFAGELGHIQVDPQGELCYCGKIGCLDTITSASALVKRVQREVLAGQATKLASYRDNPSHITISEVIQAANQGDTFAIDQLHETGYQLGKGLAIAVTLFNPEIIIVDGVLAEDSLFITNSIRQAINKHCLSGFRNNLMVEVTQLQGAAKWLGTHAYVIESLFMDV
ncbi:ROK family transcriptional regulator [Spirosoma sp. KCTC 42546]|uniref:ROK family transcriptional regulator n=1 Tax=Spirosoma sp. KCTC 42546 TaxID=2520506 RepID=UPI001158B7C6|nr:ROK family transcriptional regulator [Spirosoma sp. KCTC 42546]QDK77704.1 ROK family transcriptional regulator [Spirosoma sp. KCTC 42546]